MVFYVQQSMGNYGELFTNFGKQPIVRITPNGAKKFGNLRFRTHRTYTLQKYNIA